MSYEDDNVWAGVYGNKPSWQHPSGSNARLGAMIREGNERRAKEQKAREEASRKARMYAPVEPAPPPQTYYPDNVSSISYPSSVSTSVRSSATSPTAYEVPPPSYSLPYSRWPDPFRPEWWSECTDFAKMRAWGKRTAGSIRELSRPAMFVAIGALAIVVLRDANGSPQTLAAIVGFPILGFVAGVILTLVIAVSAVISSKLLSYVFGWGLRIGVVAGGIFALGWVAAHAVAR